MYRLYKTHIYIYSLYSVTFVSWKRGLTRVHQSISRSSPSNNPKLMGTVIQPITNNHTSLLYFTVVKTVFGVIRCVQVPPIINNLSHFGRQTLFLALGPFTLSDNKFATVPDNYNEVMLDEDKILSSLSTHFDH